MDPEVLGARHDRIVPVIGTVTRQRRGSNAVSELVIPSLRCQDHFDSLHVLAICVMLTHFRLSVSECFVIEIEAVLPERLSHLLKVSYLCTSASLHNFIIVVMSQFSL